MKFVVKYRCILKITVDMPEICADKMNMLCFILLLLINPYMDT